MTAMTATQYLQGILNREGVDVGPYSPVRSVQTTLAPILQAWAGQYLLSVSPSGSFAKGTANKSGTDIDLFISLSAATPDSLKDIYNSLATRLQGVGYTPRRQNVSINVKVGGYDVDLVPAKRQPGLTADHSLYRRKADTWTKTNVGTHITTVVNGGRTQESRVLKLWRNQKGLDFPSFYLELTAIAALQGRMGALDQNVWRVFEYLRDSFSAARVVDPANTNNVISDDLTAAEKTAIRSAAVSALGASNWGTIVA
ncbi:MAG: nucleotidyltransferase [Hyphomonadaceae bacterium]